METFDVAVLPGATGVDVDGFNLMLFEPFLDFTGDKFRAIIAADIRWDAILHHRMPEGGQDLIGGHTRLNTNGQTLSRVFIQHR